MGFVLSKFRKEKSTAAELEGLQEQIKKLEKYMINTQEQKRRFVSSFLGITIGIYVVGFALCYFFYFPPTMRERLMYLVPLLIFPVLIIYLRRMFAWYFQRKLNKNGDKLKTLKDKKSKILEQVMDKETYKVAVDLLERYGDKSQKRIVMSNQPTGTTSLNSSINLNRSIVPHRPATTPQRSAVTPYTSVYRNVNNNLNSSSGSLQLATGTQSGRSQMELRRRTPFPIVDERQRSALDRIVDLIVGDSPHDRFAIICKKCHSHNGMLPKDQYEYTTFRCAFCHELNPANKERPVAPRLALDHTIPGTPLSSRIENSDSDSSDDDASDKEEPPQLVSLEKLEPTETNTTTTEPSHNQETEVIQQNTETAETNITDE